MIEGAGLMNKDRAAGSLHFSQRKEKKGEETKERLKCFYCLCTGRK